VILSKKQILSPLAIQRTYFFFLNSLSPMKMLNGWLEITEKMMDVFSGKVQQEPKFL
jgi:hypothetical protein